MGVKCKKSKFQGVSVYNYRLSRTELKMKKKQKKPNHRTTKMYKRLNLFDNHQQNCTLLHQEVVLGLFTRAVLVQSGREGSQRQGGGGGEGCESAEKVDS